LIRRLYLALKSLRHSIQHISVKVIRRAYPDPNSAYPILADRKHPEPEKIPPSEGTETFEQPEYLAINEARLAHLESLQLPLEGKTVLDVGCGIGQLACFFVERGCKVVCVDGREQNIAALRSRFPELVGHLINVETSPLSQFGMFDIVFCYGLLYHLENPIAALRNMASVCKGLMLLETMICDHALPVLRIVDESAAFSQALHGLACRPSPNYIVLALNRVGFPFIYSSKVPPHHLEFQFAWENNLDWLRAGRPMRCVFVASRTELQNSNLVALYRD
jgi:2-polyprenyl-3-methyl-5-hydroxy-6-metoxy-1,4-benzoquinol methylase